MLHHYTYSLFQFYNGYFIVIVSFYFSLIKNFFTYRNVNNLNSPVLSFDLSIVINLKMRLEVLLLYFLTFCYIKKCTDGMDISQLEQLIRGVAISDNEGSSIDIDDHHKQKNPECGYLPEIPTKSSATSRISNAKEAKVHYPWVIYVRRYNRLIPSAVDGSHRMCAGSIITQTTAITASHCICGVSKKDIDSMQDHHKQFVECKGGKIVDFHIPPPNEVTSINKLSVGTGSMDKSKLNWIDILRAYVMGSKKKHEKQRFYEDVGLLFTNGKTGKGLLFYKHTVAKGNIKVGSVCLAAAKKEKPHMYEGNVTIVGWGKRYSDVKDSAGNPNQKAQSCATSEFGPIAARLRKCEIDDIIKDSNGTPKKPKDWGCNRSDWPAGYEYTKCSKYLRRAETEVARKIEKLDGSNVLETLWSLTNKIVVKKSFPNKKEYTCYKEDMFRDNGWCYVYKGTQLGNPEDTWGFCDSSCKLMQVTDTKPKIYHRMVWEFPFKQSPRCKVSTSDYYLCISSLLPQTSVFVFKRNGINKLKFLNVYKEKIEDSFDETNQNTKRQLGYQMTCKGDSGSGHWMYDSFNNQRALVAITSHNQGKYCGAPSNVLLTTHPNILEWIKKYSGIKNS